MLICRWDSNQLVSHGSQWAVILTYHYIDIVMLEMDIRLTQKYKGKDPDISGNIRSRRMFNNRYGKSDGLRW